MIRSCNFRNLNSYGPLINEIVHEVEMQMEKNIKRGNLKEINKTIEQLWKSELSNDTRSAERRNTAASCYSQPASRRLLHASCGAP
jgi:hypothetical protein